MLESTLGEDEPVEAWLAGKYTPDIEGGKSEQYDGVAVATDRRVLFLKSLSAGRGSNTIVLPYQSIEGIHHARATGFSMITTLTIAGNGRTSVTMTVPDSRRSIRKFVDVVNRHKHEADSGGTVTQQASPMEELERAAQLHASGTLTDAEFQKIKAKLLSDI